MFVSIREVSRRLQISPVVCTEPQGAPGLFDLEASSVFVIQGSSGAVLVVSDLERCHSGCWQLDVEGGSLCRFSYWKGQTAANSRVLSPALLKGA